jgi:primase-polymerase (primpol)-like protein
LWKDENDGKPGRWTKVPHDPRTARHASSTEPGTWAPFAAAMTAYQKRGWDGIGFMFSAEDPFTGIDFDDCHDPTTGQADAWAIELLDDLNSYTDISPTSTGCKVFVRGRKPGGRCKKKYAGGEVELYDKERFFVLTGWPLAGYPAEVVERQEALDRLYARLFSENTTGAPGPLASPGSKGVVDSIARSCPSGFILRSTDGKLDDEQLLRAAREAKDGEKFRRLWEGNTSDYGGDESSADLALCSLLRFWSGGDRVQVDWLFRRSGLMRPKWDERRGEKTYGQLTLDKAMQGETRGDGTHKANGGNHGGGTPNSNGATTGEKIDPEIWQAVLKTATLADVAQDGANIDWLWEPWIQRGCLVGLISDAGIGKTRFCADLVRRIRHGLTWPDGSPMTLPPDAGILWVPSDGNHAELTDALAKMNVPLDSIHLNTTAEDLYGNTDLDRLIALQLLALRIEYLKPALVL